MDELATRLKETSENCMKAYEAWGKDKKSVAAREPLQEAVHELRKVAARLEIEVAVSERDANGKPLPIPGHRSQQKAGQKPSRKPNHNKSNAKVAPKKTADEGNELPAFISGGADGKDDAKAKSTTTLTTKEA